MTEAGATLLARVEQVAANLASVQANLEGACRGGEDAMNDWI